MKKRLLSTLLILCMVLALIPLETAQAAETTGFCGENMTYSYSDDGTLTISGTGSMYTYSYNGTPWYEYRDGINAVVIESGITSIDSYAFFNCYNLTSVTISDGITSIGISAFGSCYKLTSVTIPNSVTSIGRAAFGSCSRLTSINVASGNASYATVGGVLFSHDQTLLHTYPAGKDDLSYSIPNSVTTIEEYAFEYCDRLTSVTIPDSVTSIGWSAFESCNRLNSINVASGNANYASISGVLFSRDHTLLHSYPAGKSNASYSIPTSVTIIGHGAFSGCSSLASVDIPDSVISIETAAFFNCDSLTDVYYGGSERQWEQISIETSLNDLLLNATIHYNSTEPGQGSGDSGGGSAATTSNDGGNEYIYDTTDPGEDTKLDADRLNRVTDPASAAAAVRDMVNGMTQSQKDSPTGIDLASLYAETAIAKAARRSFTGDDVLINATAVADLEAEAMQAIAAVDTALVNGGIATARYLSSTVTLTTNSTGEISIRIDPDILTTSVDKIRVEGPGYALTFTVSELEEDLTSILTFKAEPVDDTGATLTSGNTVNSLAISLLNYNSTVSNEPVYLANKKTVSAVKVTLPGGSTTNPVTVSLPKDNSKDTTYQAVVKSDGTSTSSKYNPATTNVDGKVNVSGTYTVATKEINFSDMANKSAEMQSAVKYLASKGIISGTTATTYSPDNSISRAEIAALLVRAMGKLDNSTSNSFTDVKKSDWYYSAAGSSQKQGYISGYEDNTFRGATTINKEQIVAVAARVLISDMKYKTPSNTAAYLGKYSDTVASWAQPQVALATKENLVVYRTDGTFSGAKNMTRGDAAIIIYRLFQKIW